ncbi:MAG: glycosyltransferase family 4 protein [Propionibacteriaceae bacterium]|nr:glycosyltransferase family 4 protein [Propionibacteriaceae bacterium]
MPTTMIITNDFPPRVGGIESFVADIVGLLDHDVVVYTSQAEGSVSADEKLGFEVVRAGSVLLPTPASTREAVTILRRSGASRVVFGAAAPLALMARSLRSEGAERIVALSHGHETWWASLPGSRWLLRRLADDVDHLATISDFTAGRISGALSAEARSRMIRLAPPVDTEAFRPADTRSRRAGERPRAIAVGRLVLQKGWETLIRAWLVLVDGWAADQHLPELIVVGDGPQRRRLEALVSQLKLAATVRLVGSLSREQVAAQLRGADVFALPVRTRLAGLNPEGLGLAFIEAAASCLPVIVGNSGGAPETVRHGVTGFVVDPHDERQLAATITRLLTDPALARSMGAAGRRYVEAKFGTEGARNTLRTSLGLE